MKPHSLKKLLTILTNHSAMSFRPAAYLLIFGSVAISASSFAQSAKNNPSVDEANLPASANTEAPTYVKHITIVTDKTTPSQSYKDDSQVHDVIGTHPDVPLNAISPKTLKTFVKLVDLVRQEYVEPVNDETLFANAMKGLLTNLDSHAEFLDAKTYENLKAFTDGEIGRIGIKATYNPKEDHWVITDVENNSPAAKKGIQEGDYLHQINDIKLNDTQSERDVEQLLAGLAGSQVDLLISKAGRRKERITLQRNLVSKQAVSVTWQEGIAVIKIPVFQNNTRQQILEQLTKLDKPIYGMVIDIRNNPGGILTTAVEIASLFIHNKDIVQIKGREGIENILHTQGKDIFHNIPIVVLQNRYSASASEVLSSSLKENKKATIMGDISYGKGTVQSVIPLNDEQAIKLTVAYYLTADGKPINKIGVKPDITLNGDENTWLPQAIAFLLKQHPNMAFRFVNPPSRP